jgi:AraC family transcriptional regulator of adaptative response / DNA-3-methyladenine glycosylase II
MRLIADGLVDRDGVQGLADTVGYSVRQLERVLRTEIGAGPIAIARAQRAQTARILIETTTLAMTDVAFASGFSSVRQFNDTVQAIFATSPTLLRARCRGSRISVDTTAAINLRLAFRQPLCPDNLFGHLAATAIPGVEEVLGQTYRRTLGLTHGSAIVELTPTPEYINCRAVLSDMRDLTALIARSRWLLDLDADPIAIDAQLSDDRSLAPLVTKSPGRRVPRCTDGAEMALRAVLGQQVSTSAAQTHAGRLVQQHGEPVNDPRGGLTHLFPPPSALGDVHLAMPTKRRETFRALVQVLDSGDLALGPGSDRDETMNALSRIPGVGPWTRQVIAMRCLGDPDAFPESDLGVRHGAELLGLPATPVALVARSQSWRPWRAYAVQYLWSVDDHRINDWPPRS